jgi:hypothetical protein
MSRSAVRRLTRELEAGVDTPWVERLAQGVG